MHSSFVSTNARGKIVAGSLAIGAAILFALIFFSIAPPTFPESATVKVKPGERIADVAADLKAGGVIKSSLLFEAFVIITSGHRQAQAGEYLFDSPQSALRVAFRLSHGIQGLQQIRVTFFEGMTAQDMAAILAKSIPGFDAKTFMVLAKPQEGMLFPDTYLFYPNATPQQVVSTLRDNFNAKLASELLPIQAFGKPFADVITMASIVEREATSTADRRIIAGILWKRIAMRMPLQVDPPFYYMLGKDSAHLTMSDLVSDSPYNTYKHLGLPPTPIGNPGFDAIEATIDPTKTDYLFYLSGRNGMMHYAATLAGHNANISKYIE